MAKPCLFGYQVSPAINATDIVPGARAVQESPAKNIGKFDRDVYAPFRILMLGSSERLAVTPFHNLLKIGNDFLEVSIFINLS